MITHLERTEEIGEIDGATERAGQRQLCPFPFREKKRMREKNVITVHSLALQVQHLPDHGVHGNY